jgi:phytoene dehydrogenase-like protein
VDSPKGVVSLGSSLFSLLGSSLLSSAEKWELLRVFTFIRTQTFERWDGVPFSEWLRASIRHPRTRAVVEMLARVATYTNAPQHASAGAFLRQVQCALRGVRYLDGGWQTLVEGVLFRAREAGVEVRTHAKVEAIEHEGKVKAVRLAGGEKLFVSGALICASPVDAARLCDVPQLRAFAAKAQPVQAACMDLGLRLLPNPRVPVCLSESAPLYLSAHSEVAKLAPDGTAALVHLIKYGAANAASDEHELEAFADKIQPGWREHVVFRRYLPSLTVSHASVLAADGGEKGRPKAKVADVQGLAIAGDWVGDRGMLLDAALASAQEAVRVLLTEVPLSTEQARGIRQVAG